MTVVGPAAREFVLSTRNPHKLREFNRILEPAGVTVVPLPDEVRLPPEEGETFADNALPKARTAAAATGRPAIADDSGIEAEALDGRPGVRSARYAGPDATDEQNLAKLMAEAPVGSGLRYVCAVAYVDPGEGIERVFFGECRGTLASSPRGTGGFGYDPAFLPDGDYGGRTMAELSDVEKDAISHRGAAIRAFLSSLTAG
ncbi:MAG TPA: RdgB/HAM1 family non-canonical purine NTP pyrophosphatase [Solirubrobacteraceae bacterium]|nr:RdgB/HAM1 family non-canonical purine NTP pyrophosphatase [Solirubrobacteraceae bacterium]